MNEKRGKHVPTSKRYVFNFRTLQKIVGFWVPWISLYVHFVIKFVELPRETLVIINNIMYY